MEHSWAALILVTVLLCSTGCLDTLFGEPPYKTDTPAPTTIPTTEIPRLPEQSSDMALQPSDLPSDYILQDRSVMAVQEVSQLARELGWRQGYFVSFYRRNSNTNDITRIRQSVSIFSTDSINGVFLLEKEELRDQQMSPGTRYEIPFPAVGERSIAFRDTNPVDPERPVTYTVIFTKKNVFEKITMSGTNTDYETLKRLVQRAEALVQ
ncbi:MAG: hypothetical protein EHM53_01525 [Methanoregulaceae archaeon]|nr:MAG: hypothetical protein EHM53_01525 [Methanoregulaceae archaeon]